MQLVLLGGVEVAGLPPEVLVDRVVDEAAVGVEAAGVGLLVDARTARVLQREGRIDPGILRISPVVSSVTAMT